MRRKHWTGIKYFIYEVIEPEIKTRMSDCVPNWAPLTFTFDRHPKKEDLKRRKSITANFYSNQDTILRIF